MTKKRLTYTILLIFVCFFYSCRENTDKISAKEIIQQINNNERVTILNKTITGDLDFSAVKNANFESLGIIRAYVNASISFINCKFTGQVKACRSEGEKIEKLSFYTRFDKNLTFINCQFHQEVNFNEADIVGTANFSSSIFYKKASFEGLFMRNKENYFSEAIFKNTLQMQRIYSLGNLNFLKAEFDGITSFQNAVFVGDIQLGAIKASKAFYFDKIKTHKGLYFTYADFSGTFSANNCNIGGKADFQATKFQNKFSMKNTVFYGKSRFNKASFYDTLMVNNLKFQTGKPDTTNIHFKMNKLF